MAVVEPEKQHEPTAPTPVDTPKNSQVDVIDLATTPARASSRFPLIRQCLSFILSQWLLLAIGLVILLAYFFPSVGKNHGHIASQWTVTYGAVILIFFVSGLSLPGQLLLHHSRNLRLHLIVQLMSFIVTPAIFFLVAFLASQSKTIQTGTLIGMIANGCLPTTIASNVVMTRLAGGDEAATMVEVTLGNLLGPFLTPILITKVYLPSTHKFREWSPDGGSLGGLYKNVMMQMGLSVFVPLFVGQVIRGIWTEKVKWMIAKFYLAKVGSLCLVALIWSTFSTAFASGSLQSLNPPTITFLLFMNLTLCFSLTILSFFLARPPLFLTKLSPRLFKRLGHKEAISICFCAPAKTQALGIPLVAAMWKHSSDQVRTAIAVPMILYTSEQILVGQGMIWWFKRWVKSEEEKAKESDHMGADSGGAVAV